MTDHEPSSRRPGPASATRASWRATAITAAALSAILLFAGHQHPISFSGGAAVVALATTGLAAYRWISLSRPRTPSPTRPDSYLIAIAVLTVTTAVLAAFAVAL